MKEKIIWINCMSDYVKYLEGLYKEIPFTKFSNIMFIYRGQGSMDWGLTPSLLRDDKWKEENIIIQECMRRYPQKFQNLNYNNNDDLIRILTIMQHYGLPTRLLDFTEDPLVALYFACEAERNEDGEVFVVKEYKHQNNTAIINSIIKYIRSDNLENLTTEEMEELVKEDSNEVVKNDLTKFTRADLININGAAVLIEPYKNNDRIIAQKGLFYLCGMEFEFKEESKTKIKYQKFNARKKICPNESNDEDSERVHNGKIRIIIPAKAKDRILHELDSIYRINKHSVYPEVDRYAEYMTESKLVTQRLIEADEIESIEESFSEIADMINQVIKATEAQEIIDYEKDEYQVYARSQFKEQEGFRDYAVLLNIGNYFITCKEFIIHILVREKRCFLSGFKYNNIIYNLSIPVENFNQSQEVIVVDNVEDNIVYLVTKEDEKEESVKNSNISNKTFVQQRQSEGNQTLTEITEKIIETLASDLYDDIRPIRNKIKNCLITNLLYGRDEDISKTCVETKKILKREYPDKFTDMYKAFKSIIEDERTNIRDSLK